MIQIVNTQPHPFCLFIPLPCTTPCMIHIGNHIISSFQHPTVSIGDGKPPRHRFNTIRNERVDTNLVRQFSAAGRKIRQRHLIVDMWPLAGYFTKHSKNHSIKRAFISNQKTIHTTMIDQIAYGFVQITSDGCRCIPMSKKRTQRHIFSPHMWDISYFNTFFIFTIYPTR